MPHQQTLDALLEIKDYEEVPVDDYRVSYDPLVSFDYCFCRAVVLKRGNLYGLSHILPNPHCLDPSHHIDGMLHEMRHELEKPKAIIVAGGGPDQIRDYCKSKSIEVVDSYYGEKEIDGRFYYRDIIIMPSLGEILIYTQDEKIVKKF